MAKPNDDTPTAAEPVPVIQPVLVTMTQEQLQALIGAATGGGGGMSAAELKGILDAQREETTDRKGVRHSNADHRHESVFSLPGGDLKNPKPKLARETFFNNHREHEDELTPAEIEAFNSITHECKARGGAWTAKFKDDGRLLINVPSHTMDDRMNLPDGLVLILRELGAGERAVSPADMAIRIADLERRLAAQESAVVLA